jgi:Flp pilus assembly protein TadG
MVALIRILRTRWRCDSGAEFVEAALAIPLLLLIVLGIMDFGLMFQQYEVITNAAREGARVGVLPNYNDADVLTRIDQYISASLLSGGGTVTRSVTHPAPVNIGTNCMTTVQVTVTYPHAFLFLSGIGRYFGGTFTTKTLRAVATMRSEIPGAACP